MKQQEQMMRDMEQVVSRRDTIITRGEAQAKIDHKTPTKGVFQKKLNEIKKKVKQTQKVLYCLRSVVPNLWVATPNGVAGYFKGDAGTGSTRYLSARSTRMLLVVCHLWCHFSLSHFIRVAL